MMFSFYLAFKKTLYQYFQDPTKYCYGVIVQQCHGQTFSRYLQNVFMFAG